MRTLLFAFIISLLTSYWMEVGERTASGKVVKVYAFHTDLVINMENDEGSYYLNRYLDKGGKTDSFKQLLTGKMVRIKYSHNTSILNPKGNSRPIDTVYLNGYAVLFSEG